MGPHTASLPRTKLDLPVLSWASAKRPFSKGLQVQFGSADSLRDRRQVWLGKGQGHGRGSWKRGNPPLLPLHLNKISLSRTNFSPLSSRHLTKERESRRLHFWTSQILHPDSSTVPGSASRWGAGGAYFDGSEHFSNSSGQAPGPGHPQHSECAVWIFLGY